MAMLSSQDQNFSLHLDGVKTNRGSTVQKNTGGKGKALNDTSNSKNAGEDLGVSKNIAGKEKKSTSFAEDAEESIALEYSFVHNRDECVKYLFGLEHGQLNHFCYPIVDVTPPLSPCYDDISPMVEDPPICGTPNSPVPSLMDSDEDEYSRFIMAESPKRDLRELQNMAMHSSQDQNFSVHLDGVKTNRGSTVQKNTRGRKDPLKKRGQENKSISVAVQKNTGGANALTEISNSKNAIPDLGVSKNIGGKKRGRKAKKRGQEKKSTSVAEDAEDSIALEYSFVHNRDECVKYLFGLEHGQLNHFCYPIVDVTPPLSPCYDDISPMDAMPMIFRFPSPRKSMDEDPLHCGTPNSPVPLVMDSDEDEYYRFTMAESPKRSE